MGQAKGLVETYDCMNKIDCSSEQRLNLKRRFRPVVKTSFLLPEIKESLKNTTFNLLRKQNYDMKTLYYATTWAKEVFTVFFFGVPRMERLAASKPAT